MLSAPVFAWGRLRAAAARRLLEAWAAHLLCQTRRGWTVSGVLAGWMLLVAALHRTDAVRIGAEPPAVASAQLLAPKLRDPILGPVVRLCRRGRCGLSWGLATSTFPFLVRLLRLQSAVLSPWLPLPLRPLPLKGLVGCGGFCTRGRG